MDPTALPAVLSSVPPGRWASYGDVARALGGGPAHARAVDRRLTRDGLPGAHRVLKADGSVGATALGDAAGVRRRLEGEGVPFSEDGRADPGHRVVPAAR